MLEKVRTFPALYDGRRIMDGLVPPFMVKTTEEALAAAIAMYKEDPEGVERKRPDVKRALDELLWEGWEEEEEKLPARKWDFGSYKFHPLWNEGEDDFDDPELRVKPGDKLYRGSSTAAMKGKKLVAHPRGGHKGRLYWSEGPEDAAGYASIAVEIAGGEPVLCEVTLTKELFRELKPGFEGLGEWYMERSEIPLKYVKCTQLTKADLKKFGLEDF